MANDKSEEIITQSTTCNSTYEMQRIDLKWQWIELKERKTSRVTTTNELNMYHN